MSTPLPSSSWHRWKANRTCIDTLDSSQLLQLHQPLVESSNLASVRSEQEDQSPPASYTIRSIRLDADFVRHDEQASYARCKAVLILSSLVSFNFHELSALTSTGGTTKTGRLEDTPAHSLSLVTLVPERTSASRISVYPQELAREPVEELIHLICSQADENSKPRVFSSQWEPILLVDFSTSCDQRPSHVFLEEKRKDVQSFPLVIQPKDDHLILTVNSSSMINVDAALASWFLLHTANTFNQIIKRVQAQDAVQNTGRMPSIPMVSELEKQIILKLSRPTLTAHELNSKKPKFVQHFLDSKSWVELILKSADLNSKLVALHWYERYNDNFDSYSSNNLISTNGDPDHHGNYCTQPKEFELKVTFQQFAHYSYILSEHIFKFIPRIQAQQGKQNTKYNLRNPVVSLLMNKNPWLVMIMFAVSLTGSSYLNLESSTPKNRLKSILKDLQIPCLLLTFNSYENRDLMMDKKVRNSKTLQDELEFENILDLSDYCSNLQNQLLSTSSSKQGRTIDDQNWEENELRTPLEILSLYESRMKLIENSSQPGNRDQIAYIVYTSGTTGQPKPIQISTSNLLNFLFNYSSRFQRKNDGSTKVLQFASYSFDVSVMSIWDTLAA